MAGIEATGLWKATFAKEVATDDYGSQREFFRVNFEQFRRSAGLLAAEIAISLPDFTVHDLTHLDALWEMASLICGADYPLNPAEAFVLGGAFLIHDLGMGLAAYPDGVDDLKKSVLWDDTIAYIVRSSPGLSKDEIQVQATGIVLRALHAKHAERLATISWGEGLYLIDNQELREAYGKIIGMVAHSHWWGTDQILQRLPPALGAFGNMPNEWGVDPVKLACIMRVSDAAHIDSRRAPTLLKAFRRLNSYSELHWRFQQRLYQPKLISERLLYTSSSAFSADEAKSWFMCYDTLKMIDRELRDVDSILGSTSRPRLNAKGVALVNDLSQLSKCVAVDGWMPVDASVHVGDVSRLVRNLGGEQLYGNDLSVPLRELIQNSCDAVKARRKLEGDGYYKGRVAVTIGRDELGEFIEVEDDGVGMSPAVLSGPLLDFGSSFWGTPMMHEEFPGLDSLGFKSAGRYGVGFFSVFMWSDRVSVISRRFESAWQDTKVLEFEGGLSNRPIIRNAKSHEYVKNGGSKVVVRLSRGVSLSNLLGSKFGDGDIALEDFLEELCPSLDVDLYAVDKTLQKSSRVIEAGDWLNLESIDFVRRVLGKRTLEKIPSARLDEIVALSENLRDIEVDGVVLGRGFVIDERPGKKYEYYRDEGVVTVGGFRTLGIQNVIGIFLGEPTKAARDSALPIGDEENFAAWATEQSRLISKKIADENHIYVAEIIRSLGGWPTGLKVAKFRGALVTPEDLAVIVRDGLKEFVVTSFASISVTERHGGFEVKLNDDVIVTEKGYPSVIHSKDSERWPSDQGWFHAKTLEGVVIETLAKESGLTVFEVLKCSEISTDKRPVVRVVGVSGDGTEIDSHVDVVRVVR